MRGLFATLHVPHDTIVFSAPHVICTLKPMPSELHAERRDATLVLTISDPASRNTLSEQVFTAGVEALEVAESNEDIRCVVLRGEGAHFCAGANLDHSHESRNAKPGMQADMLTRFHGFIEALRTFPKPVIAAVEGAAAGGGFSLALGCDLLVAARNASFTLSYGRAGLSPDGGASWQLMQRLPRNVVLQMLWLPEPLTGEQLHSLGVVNWLAEPGQSFENALDVASRLSSQPLNAVSSVKELVNSWPQHTLTKQLELEREDFLANLSHTNGVDGPEAFLDKRPPNFA